MILGKRLYPSANSAITHYTISCNISLYCDTEEVVYRYTQNVYCCISNVCVCVCVSIPMLIHIQTINTTEHLLLHTTLSGTLHHDQEHTSLPFLATAWYNQLVHFYGNAYINVHVTHSERVSTYWQAKFSANLPFLSALVMSAFRSNSSCAV